MKTMKTITLHPPRGNRRRAYGVQFSLNGSAVAAPTSARPGDVVAWTYLGGNISQSPDGGKAWSQLKALGMDTAGRSGSFTLPGESAPGWVKIDWNKDSQSSARISIGDGVLTNYVSEDQLPEEFSLRELAEAYAASYDHSGNDDGYVVAEVEDLDDGERSIFAFDGRGNFEWDTARDFIHS